MKKFLVLFLIVAFALSSLLAQGKVEEHERIGIVSPMDSEMALLLSKTEIERVDKVGDFEFHVGKLEGKDIVIVKAGMGLVLSSSCTTTLLNTYNISSVICTGIAGGVSDETKVLDVVISKDLVLHDYGQLDRDDFREWIVERGPEDGRIPADSTLTEKALSAAKKVVGEDRVFFGTIASGDQFIANEWYVKRLQDKYNAYACEMEGASLALVCYTFKVPFVVIRTLSDKADGLAHDSVSDFGVIAANNSGSIVLEMLKEL